DGVNIMVRRGRNQTNPGCGMTQPADVLIDLVTGELTAFAGLCALGHFDLQFYGVVQVVNRHAKPTAGHLLDGRPAPVAVCVDLKTTGTFAAFARIAFRA